MVTLRFGKMREITPAEKIRNRNSNKIYEKSAKYRAELDDIFTKYSGMEQFVKINFEDPRAKDERLELYNQMLEEIRGKMKKYGIKVDKKELDRTTEFSMFLNIGKKIFLPFDLSYAYDAIINKKRDAAIGFNDIMANYFDRVRHVLEGLKGRRKVLMPAAGTDIACATPNNVDKYVMVNLDMGKEEVNSVLQRFKKHKYLSPNEIKGINNKIEIIRGDVRDKEIRESYDDKGIDTIYLKGFMNDVSEPGKEEQKSTREELVKHYAEILPKEGVFLLGGHETKDTMLLGWLHELGFEEDKTVTETMGLLTDHPGMKTHMIYSGSSYPREEIKLFKRKE